MKNLLIGVAVFLGTLSAFAGMPGPVCEEFCQMAFDPISCMEDCSMGPRFISHEDCAAYEVGTSEYEACMTGDLDELLKPLSIPRNLCEEFGPIGSYAYEACMNGEYDKPMSIPRDLCAKQFGYGTLAYKQCMEGAYDKPMASFEGDCYELKGLARIKCLMINQ